MRLFLLLSCVLFVSSCVRPSEHTVQVKPETLLTSNIEDVTFAITGRDSLDSMFEWVLDDRPSEAVLYCVGGDSLCVGAEKILSNFSVPYSMKVTNNRESAVSLKYSRLLTKQCQRGIGCAMSANFIGAITNRSDFTNPALSDFQDAQKAVENYNNYYYTR
ncbi:MAG: hypothetical protein PQ612_02370 [Rickettsiales bacterium]|nr:hypothetical protein [Pseudomonadota bacterium]MDA0966043.1 hypothetical protein [Pseudomonadota bacterium]MDG4542486.1 hypothetical protein [Rickettsiales bacterium]MDG4544990.1 hypothetical protein [Rickettsiales bacterium]MDG4547113.1 hypothetical protein [Rickettsiales bacterium]